MSLFPYLRPWRAAVFFALFTPIAPVSGQSDYFHVRILRADDFHFPVFERPGDTRGAACRINDFLQFRELQLLRGRQRRNVFEYIARDHGGIYGGKVSIDCSVLVNTDHILSIRLEENSCGMTCHDWVQCYNFNPANGELIHLEDLFTADGYRRFHALLDRRWASVIDTARDGSDVLDYFDEDDFWEIQVSARSLLVEGYNGFPKGPKPDTTSMEFKLRDIVKYLSRYGRAVWGLSNDTLSRFHSKRLPGMYAGHIGERPVLVEIENDGRLLYAYTDRQIRYAHYLNGDRNGPSISTEAMRDTDPVITGVLGSKGFKGVYIYKGIKKTVALTRSLH